MIRQRPTGCHNINDMPGLMRNAAGFGNIPRPVDDERCGNATLVNPALVLAEGRVAAVTIVDNAPRNLLND